MPRRAEWRDLPQRFGNRHNFYAHMNRWSKSGVMVRVLEELQQSQVVRIKIEAVSPDSTSVKGHPDGTGAKKKCPQAIGKIPRRMEHQDSHGCRVMLARP